VPQDVKSLTVVIPNFNHGHLIGEQLASILSQSEQPTKIIIIDDASTDNSVSVIERLIEVHKNVELIRKEGNSGVNVVLNEGINLAKTEYITFAGADDRTLPGLYEKSLTLLARYPTAGLCSSVTYAPHHSGSSSFPNWTQYPSSAPSFLPPERVREILFKCDSWIMPSTAIHRRDALIAAGGFDRTLHSHADAFVSMVLALRHGACFIPEPLGVFYRNDLGYGNSTFRDEDRFEEILINSNIRMRNEFRDLFPEQLIARNNARLLFRVLDLKLDNFLARTRAIAVATQTRGRHSTLLYVAKIVKNVLRVLFFLILRYYDIPRVVLSRLRRGNLPPLSTPSNV